LYLTAGHLDVKVWTLLQATTSSIFIIQLRQLSISSATISFLKIQIAFLVFEGPNGSRALLQICAWAAKSGN